MALLSLLILFWIGEVAYADCADSLAGLPASEVWNKKRLKTGFKEIARRKLPLAEPYLQRSGDEKIDEALEKVLGGPHIFAQGSSFVYQARKQYPGKSWAEILKINGIQPPPPRRERSPWRDKSKIIKALKKLGKVKEIDLSAGKISRDRSDRTRSELTEFVGAKTDAATGKALYQGAIEVFDSYDNALKAAKLDIRKIRRTRLFGSKENALELLKFLGKRRVDLHWEAIRSDRSERTTELIHEFLRLKEINPKLTGARLARQLMKQVSNDQSWNEVLEAAGFVSSDISREQVRGRAAALRRGSLDLSKYLETQGRLVGHERKSLKPSAEQTELKLLIVETSKDLSLRQKEILREVLDYLETQDQIPSRFAIASAVEKRLHKPVTEKDIDDIFIILSQKSELSDLNGLR